MLGLVKPHQGQVFVGGIAGGFLEDMAEVVVAHTHLFCYLLQGKLLPVVLQHVVDGLCNGGIGLLAVVMQLAGKGVELTEHFVDIAGAAGLVNNLLGFEHMEDGLQVPLYDIVLGGPEYQSVAAVEIVEIMEAGIAVKMEPQGIHIPLVFMGMVAVQQHHIPGGDGDGIVVVGNGAAAPADIHQEDAVKGVPDKVIMLVAEEFACTYHIIEKGQGCMAGSVKK